MNLNWAKRPDSTNPPHLATSRQALYFPCHVAEWEEQEVYLHTEHVS